MQKIKNEKHTIKILPEVVQNKIAAGEVVERPASVVKELVENSIDAGASSITLEIEDGGKRLLRISDDGCGMSESQLVIAIERHATSKISDVDDIFDISTMGFRGEALPSIASVSRFNITSTESGSQSGSKITIEGGKVLRQHPAPPRKGTVVEARDLFFNTPARLKFMKGTAAETSAISETITRLALANPAIAMRIINGGKVTLDLPSHNSLAERISTLFGRHLSNRLAAIYRDSGEGLTIEGFAALPPESRSNSRGIYVFLNRRWIKHPGIVRVVRDAYLGQLAPRRYPFAVIYITLDPSSVDVNVHPAKEEVRFANDRMVTGSVRRAIDDAIHDNQQKQNIHNDQTYSITDNVNTATTSIAAEASTSFKSPPCVTSNIQDKLPTTNSTNKPTASSLHDRTEFPNQEASTTPPPHGNHQPTPEMVRHTAKVDKQEQSTIESNTPRHRVIAQAGSRYLVVESREGILLVDQHALHERWNYERLLDREVPISSQRLLLPVVIELSPGEAELIDEVLPILRELGFESERFGLSSLNISAIPAIVPQKKAEQLIHDIFSDLDTGKNAIKNLRKSIIASLACRASVLAGKSLTEEQAQAIMDKFHDAKNPLTCPHGRPTTTTITWEELEKRFGRR